MSEFDKETTNETAGRANYPNVTLDQEGIAFERTEQLRGNRSAAKGCKNIITVLT